MINKRVFGSPIPINVQKKLEARQNVAVGDKKPLDEINSIYTNEKNKYEELVANNFNMEADLSSRTPFARMWTGVALVNKRDFEKINIDDSVNSDEGESVDKAKKKENDLNKLAALTQQIQYKELERTVYVVGTNNLSTLDNSMNPTNSQQSGENSITFPPEHQVEKDGNKFLKPTAGITSISSATEGLMGTIKKTTVEFVVHNFHDFDKIYSKFFLRPGAQIFVDFGWDVLKDSEGNFIKLYDPAELLDLTSVDNQYAKDEKVEHKLYGEISRDSNRGVTEDGFITKCNGDVETIVGIVTNYTSKVTNNGSIECSVTITSKNSALLLYPKQVNENIENTTAKFDFDLDNLIFYEQAYKLGSLSDQNNLETGVEKIANSTTSVEDELAFQNFINSVKLRSFGSTSFVPTAMAQLSGLFVAGDEDPTDSFISWGQLEDRIFNRYFGHGDDASSISNDNKGKFTVRIDSSDGFTSFEKGFLLKQSQVDDAPNFLVPSNWDVSFSNPGDGKTEKSGLNSAQRQAEMIAYPKTSPDTGASSEIYKDTDKYNKRLESDRNKFRKFINEKYQGNDANNAIDSRPIRVYTDDGLVTKYDKLVKRVPIREIFVNIDIVKNAFKNDNNNTFRDVVEQILDEINEESYGLWDWKLVGEDNILKINDMNYSNTSKGNVDERREEFNKIFTFRIMSKDSIVTNYETSFEIPSGDIGSMYAIQAMTGTPAKMNPISTIIESHSALQSVQDKYGIDAKKIGFRYLPAMGAYNALNMDSDEFNQKQKLKYYNDVKKEFEITDDNGTQSYREGIGVVDPSVVWSSAVEDKKEKQSALFDDKYDFNNEARLEQSEKKMRREGKIVTDNVKDYYKYKVTGEFITEDHFKPIPLPMKLSITIYGIGTIKPGDIFRVDYLPELYMEYVYFQVLNVSHEVGSNGWYTTLETQFRVSPHRYEDTNLTKAPGSGDTESQENLTTILNEVNISAEDKDFLIKSIELKKEDKSNINKEPVYSGASLKGGKTGLLKSDINDGKAYMWDNDATAPSTKWHLNVDNDGILTKYWQRRNSGPLEPYSNGASDWDYIKATTTKNKLPIVEQAELYQYDALGNQTEVTSDVITCRNFSDASSFMYNVRPEEYNNYEYFSRLFTFEINSDFPIYIANPLYYWSSGRNRYNGYGHGFNTWTQNEGRSQRETYLGGVYFPGEKCYLIVNNGSPERWWAVIPNNPASQTTLEMMNVSVQDPRWDAYEWEDEGPPTGAPSKF